jgi:polysaccharide pyruvyl transferase WcaK-like protein
MSTPMFSGTSTDLPVAPTERSSALRDPGALTVTRPLSVGVFGHYGNRNLGDEAIIASVMQNLRVHSPEVQLQCFSLNPSDSASRYGVPAFHIRRIAAAGTSDEPADVEAESSVDGLEMSTDSGLRAKLRGALRRIPGALPVLRATRWALQSPGAVVREFRFLRYVHRRVRELDLLMISGSNQFLDNFGGTWGFPWTIFRWTAVARFAGTRVAFVSVGAGPIDLRLSRVLVRAAVRLANYTSYRDDPSREMIESGRLMGSGRVNPDLAHALRFSPNRSRPEWHSESGTRPVVGINPMPLFDGRYWCEPDEGKYERYVETLATFASTLLRDGYPVTFFSTQTKDEDVIDDILARMDADFRRRHAGEIRVSRSRTVEELMSAISEMDVVVPSRFHGTLLALLAGRPVLAIAYGQKTIELMRDTGQEAYVYPLEAVSASDLARDLKRLESDVVEARERISRRIAEYRIALDDQFGRVLQVAQR